MKKLGLVTLGLLSVALLAACGSKASDSKQSSSSSVSKVENVKKAAVSQAPAASSSSATSSSSSSTSESSSSEAQKATTVSFDSLDDAAKFKVYTAWLQNPAGQFVVFNQGGGSAYIINEGANGAHLYTNGQKTGDSYAGMSLVKQRNSVKVLVNGDEVELYAPGQGSSFDGNWNNINWSLQEKSTKSDLMTKYYQASQSNAQVVEVNNGAPN